MANKVKLTLKERRLIQEGMDANLSYREIGSLVGRSHTTVLREVKANRSVKGGRREARCTKQDGCTVTGLCGVCTNPAGLCPECELVDCRKKCAGLETGVACEALERRRHVCNGCRGLLSKCAGIVRYVYKVGCIVYPDTG